MRALLIGGSGLISTGIVKHLLARGADVTVFNRGQRESTLPASVKRVVGDRNDAGFAARFESERFDVVIDMICFSPEQVKASIRAFAGRTRQFVFCSTVCTYGVAIPPNVLIDESFTPAPISGYGMNKLECERLVFAAAAEKQFEATVIRPSCTYGPGGTLIDNLEFDSLAWDRIERDLPVICGGDGLGLWQATHRDDVGKAFAYAALNPKCFGQVYNATRDEVFTWADYYRDVATALGKRARVLFLPARAIVRHDPKRFGLLDEITQFHGAYSSAKAKRDIPEFRCEIGFVDGARETIADLKRRDRYRSGVGDATYDALVTQARTLGVEPIEL